MLTNVFFPPTQNGLQKTLDAQLLTGVTASATLNNVTGIQNKKGVMVIDRVDSNNNLTPNKREYISFDGTSGTTVVTLGRGLGGSTDQDHAVGAIVEFINDVVQQEALLTELEAINTAVSALPTADSTTTLTNKDLTSSTNTFPASISNATISAASYTTDTGSSLALTARLTDFIITAQAGALKFNNPTGAGIANGWKIVVRIKDNGTARALTYDTQFRALGNALPSTTVLGKTLYMGFIWNSTDSKWDLIAVAQEF